MRGREEELGRMPSGDTQGNAKLKRWQVSMERGGKRQGESDWERPRERERKRSRRVGHGGGERSRRKPGEGECKGESARERREVETLAQTLLAEANAHANTAQHANRDTA
jgi:hypothetical protein